MTHARLFCAAACLWLAAAGAPAQDAFKRVDTEDLARNPRKYFALPILYRDTLVSLPTSSRIRIDRQLYHPFSVKLLDVCYATEELKEQMSDFPLNRDYLFTGTVFPQGSRFYVIAQSVTPAADAEDAVADLQAGAAKSVGAAAGTVQEALRKIQSVHYAYAKGNQIELCELYDPKSPHFAKAMDLARAELSALEQKEKTDSIEILAAYMVAVLADKCPPPAAAPVAEEEPAPAAQEQEEEAAATPAIEEAEPEPPPEMVEEVAEEAPPAKSWWARRREQRAAAAAEKARIAEEKRLEAEREKAAEEEQVVSPNAHEPIPFTAPPEPEQESVLPPDEPAPVEPEPASTNLTWSQRRAIAREKAEALRAEKERQERLDREEALREKKAADAAAKKKKEEARQRKEAERQKKEETRRAADAARAAKAAADAGELSPTATFELRATPPEAPDEADE